MLHAFAAAIATPGEKYDQTRSELLEEQRRSLNGSPPPNSKSTAKNPSLPRSLRVP
ncbi:hypothetical protein AB0I53_29775 [Saccharopolyspora sp. NPDC050389]|uniref:hypothetical protein n=1 Tax=Saccharopolyspora sp. NPDC050389 TaxID=3155516 RepID=UPI0033C8E6AD